MKTASYNFAIKATRIHHEVNAYKSFGREIAWSSGMRGVRARKLEETGDVRSDSESASIGEARGGGGLSLEITLAYVLLALATLTLGLILGLNGRPELTSYMVMGGVIAYLVSSIVYGKARWIPLMLTLGLHIGAVTSYYSNPIVLPLVIVERWGERSVVNVDIVQLIIAYEIVAVSTSKIKQNLKPRQVGDMSIGAAVV